VMRRALGRRALGTTNTRPYSCTRDARFAMAKQASAEPQSGLSRSVLSSDEISIHAGYRSPRASRRGTWSSERQYSSTWQVQVLPNRDWYAEPPTRDQSRTRGDVMPGPTSAVHDDDAVEPPAAAGA